MELNPVTRKETFLAAAGGQDVTPPTPVTREEMFLDAIAKGGGGSSGGGVLVMHASYNDWDSGEQITLNRTAREILDAQISFLILDEDYDDGGAARNSHVFSILSIDRALDGSWVDLMYAAPQSLSPISFYANGLDDFPKTESTGGEE